MADFVTHHIMGEKARISFPGLAQAAIEKYPESFRWGCQGPDPLFFRKILGGSPLHALGNRMHREKTEDLFYVLAKAVHWLSGERQEIALSYFFGFICHYALDSEIHPYVYYQQQRICDSEPRLIPGAVHCEIEAQIDAALYLKETSEFVTTFDADDFYTLSPEESGVIASILHVICHTVYHEDIPTREFRRAMQHMLSWENFFYSDSRLVYRGARKLEQFMGRGFVLSGHMKVEMPSWDCLNEAHTAWTDLNLPDEERNDSVSELLDMACIRAYALAGRYTVQFATGKIERSTLAFSFDNGNPQFPNQ